MSKVLLTGAAGFLGGYIVPELLSRGHTVIGMDDLSKYGKVTRSYEASENYEFVEGDAADAALLGRHLDGCEHFIAAAAMIGGIPYLHEFPYDILANNERITIAAADTAIRAYNEGTLKKVTYVSSSLVFERTDEWPSREGQETQIPPPRTTYGFQKLAVEYYARSAYKQHGLPFTILRPFNCVGIGETRAVAAKEGAGGNLEIAMSHVVPDLIKKIRLGQDPLHILGDGAQVRPFTYAGDFARATAMSLEHPGATNEDFNIASPETMTIRELAELIWHRLNGADTPFRYASDAAPELDVRRRAADVTKARKVLGFEATTSIDQMLDEVIPWIDEALSRGLL